jgi:hypothetical protein
MPASDERPARLDAAITAPEIDLDRINALGKALLGIRPSTGHEMLRFRSR